MGFLSRGWIFAMGVFIASVGGVYLMSRCFDCFLEMIMVVFKRESSTVMYF